MAFVFLPRKKEELQSPFRQSRKKIRRDARASIRVNADDSSDFMCGKAQRKVDCILSGGNLVEQSGIAKRSLFSTLNFGNGASSRAGLQMQGLYHVGK